MARRYSGDSRLRRKLRRFPEALREDLRNVMEESGKEIRDLMEARAPKDEGDLGRAASYQVSRDGLSVKIGYSGTRDGFKRAWKKGGFKALWQEFGTRNHAAQPFIRSSYRERIKVILDRVDAAVTKTLRRASTGEF